MRTVVFLGYSNSGKTYAIVGVVKELAKAGMKVGTLKHIHEADFTIDTKGKDTWRHAAAGASIVVALAPKELTIIEKKNTGNMTIDELILIFKRRGVDYLIVEGLYRKLSTRRRVVRILCARSRKNVVELLRIHPKPACILCSGTMDGEYFQHVPILRLPKDMKRLMKLIC